MVILNLTQHVATPEQKKVGVIEPTDKEKDRIRELLTFTSVPSHRELWLRAEELVNIAIAYARSNAVLIGGAPFLMSYLEARLDINNRKAVYAFSTREVEECLDPTTGAVTKKSVFRHAGFVPSRLWEADEYAD